MFMSHPFIKKYSFREKFATNFLKASVCETGGEEAAAVRSGAGASRGAGRDRRDQDHGAGGGAPGGGEQPQVPGGVGGEGQPAGAGLQGADQESYDEAEAGWGEGGVCRAVCPEASERGEGEGGGVRCNHRVGRVLSLSPGRWNWDPHPLTRRRVWPPHFGSRGGGHAHSLEWEGVGESQFRRGDILCYFSLESLRNCALCGCTVNLCLRRWLEFFTYMLKQRERLLRFFQRFSFSKSGSLIPVVTKSSSFESVFYFSDFWLVVGINDHGYQLVIYGGVVDGRNRD